VLFHCHRIRIFSVGVREVGSLKPERAVRHFLRWSGSGMCFHQPLESRCRVARDDADHAVQPCMETSSHLLVGQNLFSSRCAHPAGFARSGMSGKRPPVFVDDAR